MKKIIVTLAVCAAVLSLTACSSSSGDTGGNYGNYGGNTGGNYGGNTGGNYGGNTQPPTTPAVTTPVEETKVTNKAYTFGSATGNYTGDWKDGKPNGNGTFVCDNYTATGEWLDGNLNGQGQVTYASGTVHKGNFVNNKLNGANCHKEYTRENGTKTTEDGTYNNGNITSGKLVNTATDNSVTTLDGNWGSDGYLSSGTKFYEGADGTLVFFEGILSNGNYNQGTLQVQSADGSGIIVDGTWTSDEKFYNGTYKLYNSVGAITETGTVTNGQWVDDTTKAIKDFAGGFLQGWGQGIQDEHPFIGGFLEGFGQGLAG